MNGIKTTILSCMFIIGTIWGLVVSYMVGQAIWMMDSTWTTMALAFGVGITIATCTIMGCILGFIWLGDKNKKPRYYDSEKQEIVEKLGKMTPRELQKMHDHMYKVQNEEIRLIEQEIEKQKEKLERVKGQQ